MRTKLTFISIIIAGICAGTGQARAADPSDLGRILAEAGVIQEMVVETDSGAVGLGMTNPTHVLEVIEIEQSRPRGPLNLPGLDFLWERVKDHGFTGRAWDIKGRPYQTAFLALNDKGPVYIGAGIVIYTAGEDELDGLLGAQLDGFHLWRKAREWRVIEKIKLMRLPDDWRLLGGPLTNVTRVRLDKMRIDRDVIYNLAVHIPIGYGSAKPEPAE